MTASNAVPTITGASASRTQLLVPHQIVPDHHLHGGRHVRRGHDDAGVTSDEP